MSKKIIDPGTGLEVIIKQPWEDRPYNMDFSTDLDTGETLTAVDQVQVDNLGLVTGSTNVVAGTFQVSGQTAQAWFSAGTDGEHYKIHFRCSTSVAGKKVEADGIMYVQD